MNTPSLRTVLVALFFIVQALLPTTARASIAYGSINNFDTVNDTTHECHGFEIELDDCHSTDITYTYNFNHYGVPEITEDSTDPTHPKVFIRWQSRKNANGSWAAYTAIPAGPINPTNGHMFTNPNVNFGGEHFGVGYRVQPSAVLYNWLIDNGAGTLVRGGAVQVSTPTFTYYPPVAAAPAQVQAVIVPPVPPAPPVKEFGKAVWMKEVKTTTHNQNKVKLRDLVSDDPNDPNDKNWRNGEPDEIEVEWRILQKKTSAADGGPNNEVAAAPEDLPNGKEVVTRRYEFFKYVGPLDADTGEAMGDLVGPDGIHGSGTVTYADHFDGALGEWVTITTDMSTKILVGDFTGAQMAAVDVDAVVGLIDHVGEGRIDTPFAGRAVVIEGVIPFTSVREGVLPTGMAFDEVTGILSGTPTESGSFQFKITASDGVNPDVSKNYTLLIAAVNAELPPSSLLDTTASPVGTGTTTGDGAFAIDANATVTAAAELGFVFVNWTDNGKVVSTNSSYTLVMDVNHSLVANFLPIHIITTGSSPLAGGTTTGDGDYEEGVSVTVTATPNATYSFTNWTDGGFVVSNAASYTFNATADRDLVANFTQSVSYTISTSAAPAVGGATGGSGIFASGSSVSVTATPNAGYNFTNWTQSGAQVSSSASYTFPAAANRALVANFTLNGGGGVGPAIIATTASPLAGGTVTGGGTYEPGSSVTLNSVNNAGYQFTEWREGGVQVGTVKTHTFTAAASRTITAVFAPALSIGVFASPPDGGLVEADAPSYIPGDGADVHAQANPGYTFQNWTQNGTVVSTNAIYAFTINASRNLVANFTSAGNVTISLTSNDPAGGTVSGGGSKVIGSPVAARASPTNGYKFTFWSEGGLRVNTDKDYQFAASIARNLVANFVAIPATGMKETENPDEMEFEWPDNASGWVLQESADIVNWVNSVRQVTTGGGKKKSRVNRVVSPHLFFRLVKP